VQNVQSLCIFMWYDDFTVPGVNANWRVGDLNNKYQVKCILLLLEEISIESLDIRLIQFIILSPMCIITSTNLFIPKYYIHILGWNFADFYTLITTVFTEESKISCCLRSCAFVYVAIYVNTGIRYTFTWRFPFWPTGMWHVVADCTRCTTSSCLQ